LRGRGCRGRRRRHLGPGRFFSSWGAMLQAKAWAWTGLAVRKVVRGKRVSRTARSEASHGHM
jgi:hypothetical protein